MYRLVFAFIFLGLAVLSSGCNRANDDLNSQQGVDENIKIDQKAARAFSDALVSDLINENKDRLYQKMEKGFREITREEDISGLLERVYTYSGKPLEAKFKSDETGYKQYLAGENKPLRKYWYSVRTTKHDMGTYYLFIEVVPEDSRLVCSGWSIVNFPSGVPEALK